MVLDETAPRRADPISMGGRAHGRANEGIIITAILVVATTAVFGCATAPPATPIEDPKSVIGKWEGWGRGPAGGTSAVWIDYKGQSTLHETDGKRILKAARRWASQVRTATGEVDQLGD